MCIIKVKLLKVLCLHMFGWHINTAELEAYCPVGFRVDSGGQIRVSDFWVKFEFFKNQFLRGRVNMTEPEAY